MKNRRTLTTQMIIAYFLAAILLLVVLVPFFTALVASFKGSEDFYGSSYVFWPTEWKLSNYAEALAFTTFTTFMMNSAICAIIVTLVGTTISACAAYGFARIDFYGRNVVFGLFVLTQGIPFAVICIPTYAMLSQFGLVNTLAGLIIPQLAFPMGTFILRQTMRAIPKEFEEAALLDGCNRFTTFTRIFFPLSRNSILSVGIFTFMKCWNNYIWPLVIISDKAKYTLPIGLTLYSVDGGLGKRPEWSVILAACIMSVLPILNVYLFTSRKFIDGVSAGGVKG